VELSSVIAVVGGEILLAVCVPLGTRGSSKVLIVGEGVTSEIIVAIIVETGRIDEYLVVLC
jgi:hypothetical protein